MGANIYPVHTSCISVYRLHSLCCVADEQYGRIALPARAHPQHPGTREVSEDVYPRPRTDKLLSTSRTVKCRPAGPSIPRQGAVSFFFFFTKIVLILAVLYS